MAGSQQASLAAAFPKRPLKLKLPERGWRLVCSLVFLCAIVALGAALYLGRLVPDLLSDHAVRHTAEPVPLAAVSFPVHVSTSNRSRGRKTSCLSDQDAAVTDCDMRIEQRPDKLAPRGAGGERAEVVRKIAFFGGFTTAPVRAMGVPGDTTTLTTDYAIEMLPQRMLFVAVWLGAAALAILGALWAMAKTLRPRRLAKRLSGKVLTPVAVHLSVMDDGVWVVAEESGRETQWRLPKKAQPFPLRSRKSLAVTVPGGAVVPLDEKLTWLDLTDAERSRLMQARDTAMRPNIA